MTFLKGINNTDTDRSDRTRSAQPSVTQTITARRLRFFGHIVRSDSDEDHKRAFIDDPPKGCEVDVLDVKRGCVQ